MSHNSTNLVRATLIGTVAQCGMVAAGHYTSTVANLFAVAGMAISLAAGALYARRTAPATRAAIATGGAIVGGCCAILGIAVSYAHGDVPALILLVGTLSSTATGAIGGIIARPASTPRPRQVP